MGFEPRLKGIENQSRFSDKEITKDEANDYDVSRNAQLVKEFNAPNMRNLMLMKAIEGKDPAYAKHMIDKNDILSGFAFKMGGGIDILSQPVCGRCEGVGTWGDFSTTVTEGIVGYCDACGHTTKDPITVEQYLSEYVARIDPDTMEAMRSKLNDLIELMEEEEKI